MAIYIPGWAEGLLQSGDLRRLGGAAVEKFAPDLVANRRLQALVQQNPALLSQIENMTPEARMAMEQTLGFKKKTPLQSLPVGAELSSQMEMKDYIKNLTPAQRELRLAAKAGTKTPEQISREDQLFQQNLQNGTLQNQILTGQAKDIERVGKQVDAAIAKYPTLQGVDINKIVKGAVRSGTPVDPQLITAIQADSGAKQLFDIAYTSELAKFKSELDTRLAKTRSTQDEALLLRTLTEIGNQLNDQEARTIAEMNIELNNFEKAQSTPANLIANLSNPNAVTEKRAAIVKRFEDRLTQIRGAARTNTDRTTSLVDKLGLKSPTAPPPPTSAGMNMPVGPTVDAEARLALDAIRQKPQDEMRIRAAYKQRTGRDLP